MTTTVSPARRRKARRITVYEASDGWRYRVQSANWQIIAASEEGRKNKARLVARLRVDYPGVELIVREAIPR